MNSAQKKNAENCDDDMKHISFLTPSGRGGRTSTPSPVSGRPKCSAIISDSRHPLDLLPRSEIHETGSVTASAEEPVGSRKMEVGEGDGGGTEATVAEKTQQQHQKQLVVRLASRTKEHSRCP